MIDVAREITVLTSILHFLKITDVYFSLNTRTGDFKAKDEDGNRWTASEFYDFLINDVFVYSYLVGEFELLRGDGTVEGSLLYDHAQTFVEKFKYYRNHSKPIGKVILYEQADGKPDKDCLAVVRGANIEIRSAVPTISVITEELVDDFIRFAVKRDKQLPFKRI